MIAEIASIARTAPAMIPNTFSPFFAFCLFSLVITFAPNSSSFVVTATLSSTSSSREISNSSASKTSLSRSGVESPSSHLDTVWRVTSSRLASSSWESPFSHLIELISKFHIRSSLAWNVNILSVSAELVHQFPLAISQRKLTFQKNDGGWHNLRIYDSIKETQKGRLYRWKNISTLLCGKNRS